MVQGQFAGIERRIWIIRVSASFVCSGRVGMPNSAGTLCYSTVLAGLCMIGRSLNGSRVVMIIMVVVFTTLLMGMTILVVVIIPVVMTILTLHHQGEGGENQ